MPKTNTNALAQAMAAFVAQGGNLTEFFASAIGQDRIIRKETALGFVRELEPPMDHIGLEYSPFLNVATDEVIFDFVQGFTDGLAPARAEDAESELAQKDDVFPGQGRASVIDWALKDHYTASDISRYREALRIREVMQQTQSLPLTVDSMTEDWASKLARDTARRRRKLDNRIEKMIWDALGTSIIAYNDGKIVFSVNFQRPSDQAIALQPAATTTFGTTGGGATQTTLGHQWTVTTADPILDVLNLQEYMFDKYGVRITRAVTSRKVLNAVMNSEKFAQRAGFVGTGAGGIVSGDPNYLIDGWGPAAAVALLERVTGVTFREYDSVYRTRPIGSTTVTNNRFLAQNRIVFLPDEGDLNQIDDTAIGFASTLTSPHPAGEWASGFYEWEKEFGVDPWGLDMGTGIKAFPVFPHLEYSATVDVLA